MSKNTGRIEVQDLQELVDKDQVEVLSESVRLIEDEVYHEDLHIGRSDNLIHSGIVLSAFRLRDIPCSPKKISDLYGVEIRDLILSYCHICRNIDFLSIRPTKWTVFLDKYGELLNISESTLTTAFAMGQRAEENGFLSGRKPRNYAVSCIYAAIKHNDLDDTWITQRRLAEESNVGESTIRVTYKKILENYENT